MVILPSSIHRTKPPLHPGLPPACDARWGMVTGLAIAALCLGTAVQAADLRGGWEPEIYVLKDGSEYQVKGRIFFTQTEWTVLFFVVDEEGKPRRGSGEGGTYTLKGEDLVFTHLFNMSAGEEYGSFTARPLSYEVRDASEAQTEPCRVESAGDQLTIHFPSGNRIKFRRSSKP